jgi:hypothetical protein
MTWAPLASTKFGKTETGKKQANKKLSWYPER